MQVSFTGSSADNFHQWGWTAWLYIHIHVLPGVRALAMHYQRVQHPRERVTSPCNRPVLALKVSQDNASPSPPASSLTSFLESEAQALGPSESSAAVKHKVAPLDHTPPNTPRLLSSSQICQGEERNLASNSNDPRHPNYAALSGRRTPPAAPLLRMQIQTPAGARCAGRSKLRGTNSANYRSIYSIASVQDSANGR